MTNGEQRTEGGWLVFKDDGGNYFEISLTRLEEFRMSDDRIETFLQSVQRTEPTQVSAQAISATPSSFVRAVPSSFVRAVPSSFVRAVPSPVAPGTLPAPEPSVTPPSNKIIQSWLRNQ